MKRGQDNFIGQVASSGASTGVASEGGSLTGFTTLNNPLPGATLVRLRRTSLCPRLLRCKAYGLFHGGHAATVTAASSYGRHAAAGWGADGRGLDASGGMISTLGGRGGVETRSLL